MCYRLMARIWVTWLDQAGTGGSILAIPAILSVTALVALAFIVGVCALGTGYARYFLLSAILIPTAFLAASALLR